MAVSFKALLLILWLALASTAGAQTFPQLTGRVVDGANILSPADEADLDAKLAALESASSRQLVVATVPDLQGLEIEDYGYRLGRAWKIGQTEADNGAILLVAPNQRKVRIEAGYGLEAILTDAFSSLVIQNQILPAFRNNDYPGGIRAGVDALIVQLQAPPEVAEGAAMEAAQERASRGSGKRGGSFMPMIFWMAVLFFIVLPMLRGMGGGGRGGRRYRGRSGMNPATSILLWEVANAAMRSGRDGGGGGFGGFGGGGGGGGGFGGFSGGGGSFGGGGASGSW